MSFGIRRLASLLCAFAALSLYGVVASAPGAFATEGEGCPNEAIRTGQDSNVLPDCRAWELVTPAEKGNVEPESYLLESLQTSGYVASLDGGRIGWRVSSTVPVTEGVGGSETVGLNYVATRGSSGWSSEDVMPPQSPDFGLLCPWLRGIAAYSPDLSRAVLADGWGQNYRSEGGVGNEDCGHDEPLLDPEEPLGYQNLFVRNNESVSYRLVDVTPMGVASRDAQFDAASADMSHVVFDENAQLTSDALPGDNLYEWTGGGVRLVTVLPDGKAVAGTLPWWIEWERPHYTAENIWSLVSASNFTNTVSADGSRIFFEAEGNLYVREHGASTVQLDASQGSGPGGGGRFMWATADGSKVFFIDEASAGLTQDTQAGSGENLYEYDLPAEDGKKGKLIDLTAGVDARAQGVSGISEDGSYVYFVADGALAQGATAGGANLYVSRDGGAPLFIATLNSKINTSLFGNRGEMGDYCDWYAQCSIARVSPDGRYIGFDSMESLTGYDNRPARPWDCSLGNRNEPGADTEEPCREVYLYDATANSLACVSCDPNGARPTGMALIRAPSMITRFAFLLSGHPTRNVSDAGQVFFDSPDGLVPHDNNGRRDVYEYEHGHVHLISSGTNGEDSLFVDASASGNDVFFTSAQQLVRRDTDSSYDLYDARVNGGFPEAGIQQECADEGCRGLASVPPVLSLPDSASLLSSGNVTPAQPKAIHRKAAGKRKLKHRRRRRGRAHGRRAKKSVSRRRAGGGK